MGFLLSIRNLSITFFTEDGPVKAADDINLDITEGKTVGLIGESGCGKSVLGLSIFRLLPGNARIEGSIYYRGQDLLRMSEAEMRRLRGRELALIPQSPSTSLNPVLTAGVQIAEALRLHQGLTPREAEAAAVRLLRSLGLPAAEKTARRYPHQLSGGMRQRVLAAMGVAGQPSLLVADEPTKGLDAGIRMQVVEVLGLLTRASKLTMLLITHDLRVAAALCQEVAVMYAGEVIEHGPAEHVLAHPLHPYTKGLIGSLPRNGLVPIPGHSPSLVDSYPGCKFYPRCAKASKACAEVRPPLARLNGCTVRCLHVAEGRGPEEGLCHGGLQEKAH
ncbi:MAG: ABC transporter ATP-binding protein [Clostridia bacterium]|nr:ABC transporter ATP-binding protein [Clostridia bacterium]MDH7573964.1 ABC transporter ATP-binding protein [Clostridia bacterium]